MGITIRRATKADIPALVRLDVEHTDYHSKLDPFFKTGRQMKPIMQSYFEKQIRRINGRVFVAEEGKRVIGFVIFEVQRSARMASVPKVGFIRSIHVDQKSRRSGAGGLLLDEATKWFKSKKLTRLELGVLSNNPIGLKFWNKYGFKERQKRMWKKI